MEELCATKEGRDAAEFYKTIERIDDELLKQCEKPYQGEVAFLCSKCGIQRLWYWRKTI